MIKVFNLKLGNSTRKLICLKLADNANDQGVCWPSYTYIADQCEVSVRTAMSHISWLADHKYLVVNHRKYETGRNKSNSYQLTFDRGVAFDSANISPSNVSECLPDGENISLADGAGDSLADGANDAEDGAGDSLADGAGDSPRTCNSLEPVKEPAASREKDVFFYWKKKTKDVHIFFTEAHEKIIAERLAENFSLADLKSAVDGNLKSEWHQGANPSSAVYNSIDLIFRNAENVTKFMSMNDTSALQKRPRWRDCTDKELLEWARILGVSTIGLTTQALIKKINTAWDKRAAG